MSLQAYNLMFTRTIYDIDLVAGCTKIFPSFTRRVGRVGRSLPTDCS